MMKNKKIGMIIAFKANLMIIPNMKKDNKAHLKMERPIKGNGTVNKDMDMECKYGLMDPNMRDIGKKIKLMGLEHHTMFLEIDMKENGRKICNTEKENLQVVMGLSTKDSGKMMLNMVMVRKVGLTNQSTMAIITKE